MSSFKVFSVSFIIALGFSLCLATIPGLRLPQAPAMPSLPDLGQQYTVNVHFIPAIHRADCSIGGTWGPPSLECARCFCFAPALSRCFPKSGCNPTTQAPVTSSTAPSSTIKPEPNPNPNPSPNNPPSIPNLEPPTTKPEAAPVPVPQEQVSVTPTSTPTPAAPSTTEAAPLVPQEENQSVQPIRSVKP